MRRQRIVRSSFPATRKCSARDARLSLGLSRARARNRWTDTSYHARTSGKLEHKLGERDCYLPTRDDNGARRMRRRLTTDGVSPVTFHGETRVVASFHFETRLHDIIAKPRSRIRVMQYPRAAVTLRHELRSLFTPSGEAFFFCLSPSRTYTLARASLVTSGKTEHMRSKVLRPRFTVK